MSSADGWVGGGWGDPIISIRTPAVKRKWIIHAVYCMYIDKVFILAICKHTNESRLCALLGKKKTDQLFGRPS